MKLIIDYIELLKIKKKTKTQSETMRLLDLKRSNYDKYKDGGSISDKNAIKLAEMLKIDPMEIISYSKALKPHISKEEKNIWLSLAKKSIVPTTIRVLNA